MTETPDQARNNGAPEPALLHGQLSSIRRQLTEARLRAANLEAAIRAALGAAEDGEPDPLEYLRIEFPDIHGGTHGA